MKLLRTIRMLFRSRRAAGGEVRPGRPADDGTLVRLSPGHIEDIDPRVREAVGDDLLHQMNKISRQQRRRMW